MADIFCFPSFREGLSVSLMEAMAAGLPIICSNIRGNNDLIEDEVNGFLCNYDSIDNFRKSIEKLINDSELKERFGIQNKNRVLKLDTKNIIEEIERIYDFNI